MNEERRGTSGVSDAATGLSRENGATVLRDQHSAVPNVVAERIAGRAPGRARQSAGYSPALNLYVILVACSILVLICSGGMVTSESVGLSVPDWPNSYGYNMFAFPVSRWVGGVLLEHTHRLGATAVGTFIIVLAVWLARAEKRRWVRNLGWSALGLVILQGLLGGLRVVYQADWVGVFHGCVAQAFLALVSVIALVTSRWWLRLGGPNARRPDAAVLTGYAKTLLTIAVLIYLQLALGATMRHAHAGLSIHDFPKAYGHWWPQVHKADMPAINVRRAEMWHEVPTTLAQIHLQMTHRMNALLITGFILAAMVAAWRRRAVLPDALRRLTTAGVGLVAVQISLGIYTILSNKAADVATAHVAVGATLFVWSVVSYVAVRRWMGAPRALPPTEDRVVAALNLEAVA